MDRVALCTATVIQACCGVASSSHGVGSVFRVAGSIYKPIVGFEARWMEKMRTTRGKTTLKSASPAAKISRDRAMMRFTVRLRPKGKALRPRFDPGGLAKTRPSASRRKNIPPPRAVPGVRGDQSRIRVWYTQGRQIHILVS